MAKFVLEAKFPGGSLLTRQESINIVQAVREAQRQLLDSGASEIVVYVPVRVLRASREVRVTDAMGKSVAVDTPLRADEGGV